MSETIASLSQKIESATDLQGVVRSMKALAASSIGQYEKSVIALADYYRTVELGLGVSFRADVNRAQVVHPTRPSNMVKAIVFGSDQGLVGNFNDIVADFAIKSLADRSTPVRVWAVGERVHARLSEAGLNLAGVMEVPTSIKGIPPFVGQILLASVSEDAQQESGELHLFYNRPSDGSVYEAATQRLLPLDEQWRRELMALPWPSKNLPEPIGSHSATLRSLIREYLFISLFRGCAESLAAENASRLAAMQRADKNIDDLLTTLTSTFQQVRQSGIDAELFDVISGFEALKK